MSSYSYAEALRKLGLRPCGGNHALFRRYVDRIWKIPTDHFDPHRARLAALRHESIPLQEILVQGSSYNRSRLKRRLIGAGLKRPECEICGQTEIWHGRPMSLTLDHINGIPDDNRIENLRIVCPNCAATLDTHCGRKNLRLLTPVRCPRCSIEFVPRRAGQRYCSAFCGVRHGGRDRGPKPATRKVQRPPYEQLCAEVAELGFSAVGRTYGVSDNAVRKWLRWYEADRGGRSGP